MNIIIADEKLRHFESKIMFINALEKSDWGVITMSVEKGIDINCRDTTGCTPLHIAVNNGNLPLIEFLLKQDGIKLDARDSFGDTPLVLAVKNQSALIMQTLLGATACPNVQNKFGYTALHHACLLGNANIVGALLKHNAYCNIYNIFDKSPIHIAAIDIPNEQNVQLLIDYGADLNWKPICSMPIFLECCVVCKNEKQLDMIRLLLDNGVNIFMTDRFAKRTCLHFVALTGYIPLAQLLIERGANKSVRDQRKLTPADLASRYNPKLAEILRIE